VPVPHDYLDGRGAFPERLPWLVLIGRFLDEMDQAVDRWAAWAAETVEAWPDDLTTAEPDWVALEEIARNIDERSRRR
jgi:PadR family transcriptional regulator, regulatory protein AphA